MPPKKKSATKQTAEPEEPLEYASYTREKSAKLLVSNGGRKNVNCDIEQNIREIRALLKANAEIFERCMGSASKYRNGKSALFTRYGFDVVKVRQNQNTSRSPRLTEIITEIERSQKTFDISALSKLPAGLDNVIVVKYQTAPYSHFIDYRAFFQSALLLHDDVLAPFLAKLKCHIESIQVSSGNIEMWLLENKSNHEFLEATFEKKLDVPSAEDYIDQDSDDAICAKCGQPYSSHSSRYDYDSN